MKKKLAKNKFTNQTSFYFEDFLENKQKIKKIEKKTIILKIEFIYYFFSFFFNNNFLNKNSSYII